MSVSLVKAHAKYTLVSRASGRVMMAGVGEATAHAMLTHGLHPVVRIVRSA